MARKIFLLCLAVLLIVQGAASAKKNSDLPEEERIKIAIEVTDSSRHKELGTAEHLEDALIEELFKKNLVDILDPKIFQDDTKLILDEDTTAEKKSPFENLGELLVFDAIELPRNSRLPADFNQTFYKNFGVDYVIHCEVIALGLNKVYDDTIPTILSVAGGVTELVFSGNGGRDETLSDIGTIVGLGGFVQVKRTALSNVVNMKFINVETGQVMWEKNLTGQAIKHHKPRGGFPDAWTQAYMESVANSAKLIAQRVNKYVDKVIIKGKSDKNFSAQ